MILILIYSFSNSNLGPALEGKKFVLLAFDGDLDVSDAHKAKEQTLKPS